MRVLVAAAVALAGLIAVSVVVPIVVPVVAALASAAPARQVDPAAADVARIIERELKAARVPGASYAIAAGGRTSTGSYGVADAGRGTAMTPDTLVQVGSLTKLLTSFAVTSTLERRGLAVTTPVGHLLDGVSPRVAAATYHELLSQTSGLRDEPGQKGATDEGALAARVRAIGDADFLLPAGTVFSYSNLGYAVAGAALERLRGEPFADALREAALEPLGMRSATMRLREVGRRPRASGHRVDRDAVSVLRDPDLDTGLWPSGYLWTSARDMSRLLTALVDPAPVDPARGVPVRGMPASIVTRILTPHANLPNVFPGGSYGYGVMLGSERGIRVYEHAGTQTGFASLLRIAPDRRFGFVILTNLDEAPLRRIAQVVTAAALGLPAASPPPGSGDAVTPDDLGPLLGTYRNRGTADVAARDGRVVLILDGGPPLTVSRIAPTRYIARAAPGAPGPEFILQPAAPPAPAYLHFGLWAFVR
jgi:CubicO group peptidase (beta-lactamase class C family)